MRFHILVDGTRGEQESGREGKVINKRRIDDVGGKERRNEETRNDEEQVMQRVYSLMEAP